MGRFTLILFCLLSFQVLVSFQKKTNSKSNGELKITDLQEGIDSETSGKKNQNEISLRKQLEIKKSRVAPKPRKEKMNGKKNNINDQGKLEMLKKKKRVNRVKHIKNSRGRQATGGAKQSCSATQISETEFQVMIECLEFERNQLNNFETQRNRVNNQVKIVNNKNSKREDFKVPADNLGIALGVNGTDVTKATCGDGLSNATTRDAGPAITLFQELLNCTNVVASNCNSLSVVNDTAVAKYAKCAVQVQAMITKNTACKNKPIETIGSCWTQIKDGEMATIKSAGCIQFSASFSTQIAKLRTQCIKEFAACKVKEDNAVIFSSECASGTVKTLEEINKQTIITKETLGLARSLDPMDDDYEEEDDDYPDYY